jgi:hypothetical protein
MECHVCSRQVESGDRFCNGCGTSLAGVTDTTEMVDAVDESEGPGTAPNTGLIEPAGEQTEQTGDQADLEQQRTELLPTATTDDDDIWDAEPVWAATGSMSATDAPDDAVATGELPETQPITEVWMSAVPVDDEPTVTPYDLTARDDVVITGQIDVQPTATAQMPIVPVVREAERGFRFTLVLLISLATGIVSLIALFANIISITSDTRLVQTADTPPGFRTGTWIVDDLADNLSIAGLIAVVLVVVGGVASGFRWRWGAGLAGGAGLAIAGVAAVTVGLAQTPIDIAHAFAKIPSTEPFVLTITRDLGYWLLIAAGALGVVLFFAAVNDAVGDHRPGLNPWIAALGALSIVVAGAGPSIPENQAIFSDNWYLIEGVGEPSALLLVGRLVQLGLFLIGGVVGFLSVRRWGLGLAIGATLPGIWLIVTTLFDITDHPVGLGFRNPGAVDMHVHGVTIIGASAVLAMLVLGVIGAYDQGTRERY